MKKPAPETGAGLDLPREAGSPPAQGSDGDQSLREAVTTGDVALVLGSEGSGVRRLVRERCDTSAFIPIDSATESLNVSNAAAVALYELKR